MLAVRRDLAFVDRVPWFDDEMRALLREALAVVLAPGWERWPADLQDHVTFQLTNVSRLFAPPEPATEAEGRQRMSGVLRLTAHANNAVHRWLAEQPALSLSRPPIPAAAAATGTDTDYGDPARASQRLVEQELYAAVERAAASEPWPAGRVLPGADAEHHLNWARQVIEAEIKRRCQKLPAADWLYLLRRVLPEALGAGTPLDFRGATELAEIVTGLAESGPEIPSLFLAPGVAAPGPAVELLPHAAWLCRATLALRRLHATIRTADKGAAIEFPVGARPVGRPTVQQRAAMRLYDERSRVRFIGRGTGTIPAYPALWTGSGEIPYVRRRGEQPPADGESHEMPSGFEFELLSYDLSPMRALCRLAPAGWADGTAMLWAALWLGGYILHVRPELRAQVTQFGYIKTDRDTCLNHFRTGYENLRRAVDHEFPTAQLPADAADLLDALEREHGALWPPIAGPVVRTTQAVLLLDLHAATERLDRTLADPTPDEGGSRNRKTRHFEEVIQELIDDSPWGGLSATIRKCRGEHLETLAGQQISEYDAIGRKGDVLLLVDAYSKPYPAAYITGGPKTVRNYASSVEKKVREEMKAHATLCLHPKGRNYDFSAFTTIVNVVCLPITPYLEPGMMARPHQQLRLEDLASLQNAAPGLRRATSIDELVEWLYR